MRRGCVLVSCMQSAEKLYSSMLFEGVAWGCMLSDTTLESLKGKPFETDTNFGHLERQAFSFQTLRELDTIATWVFCI